LGTFNGEGRDNDIPTNLYGFIYDFAESRINIL